MDMLSDKLASNTTWNNVHYIREISTDTHLFPFLNWQKLLLSNSNTTWPQLRKPLVRYDLFLKPGQKEISRNLPEKMLQECWFSICSSDTNNNGSSLMTSVANLKSKSHDY